MAFRRRRDFLGTLYVFPPKPIQIAFGMTIQIALKPDERYRPSKEDQHFGTKRFPRTRTDTLSFDGREAADLDQPFRILGHPSIEHCNSFSRQRVCRCPQEER